MRKINRWTLIGVAFLLHIPLTLAQQDKAEKVGPKTQYTVAQDDKGDVVISDKAKPLAAVSMNQIKRVIMPDCLDETPSRITKFAERKDGRPYTDDEKRTMVEEYKRSREVECRIGIPEMLAGDESHGRVFLLAPVGSGPNHPLFVLEYDMAHKESIKLAELYGTGTKQVALSPDGRYLAISYFSHLNGRNSNNHLAVFDVANRQELSVKYDLVKGKKENETRLRDIEDLHWEQTNQLHFTETVHKFWNWEEPEPQTLAKAKVVYHAKAQEATFELK